MDNEFKLSMTADEIDTALQSMKSFLNNNISGITIRQTVSGGYELYAIIGNYTESQEGIVLIVDASTKVPIGFYINGVSLPIEWEVLQA